MWQKSCFPSWFLCYSYIVTISLLLILSSTFIVQFSDDSVIPFLVIIPSPMYVLPSAPINIHRHIGSSESVRAAREQTGNTCGRNQGLLKVYMYDLPPEFHFGLLGWIGGINQTWPDVNVHSHIPRYPGGLNIQNSIEYWITLDLLSSTTPNVTRPCSAIRVQNASQADVIFIPFFSSLSYNKHSKLLGKEFSLDRMLQDKLLKFLTDCDEWKRLGGKDHLIVAHHPNSMLYVRKKLNSSMFVLADFGRYQQKIANLKKDVIAPYKHLVRTIPKAESAPYDKRPILAYFRGRIHRKDGGAIRQKLYYLLKNERDVHFTFGSVQQHGIETASRGMGSSKFCLHIAGDTPSSNRLFDAIASLCVPVIVSDQIELPFEDFLDYSEFSIFVHSSDALKKGFLLNVLRRVGPDVWNKMWKGLGQVQQHFEYQYPSQPDDAVDMIWKALSHKMYPGKYNFHRNNRYSRSELLSENN